MSRDHSVGNSEGPYDCSFLNEDITLEEVENALKHTNSHKAPGVDEIKASFLKNGSCLTFLHAFYQKCLKLGQIPAQWLKSIIKPIPKPGGDPLNPSDYKGISLQSVVMKVFCCILNARLGDCLEDNDLLAEEQNGFRKERGCIDHLFSLTNIVETRRCLGKNTYACFIDFSKAFDSVNREALWYKVHHNFGIHGPFLTLLKSLYENVQSAVKVNNNLSDWFEVHNGVKQGCILSPSLFSMFINDLVHDINLPGLGIPCGDSKISTLLFADDVVILSENEQDLQKLLNILSEWCSTWGIRINPKKSKCMHFRSKRKTLLLIQP